MPVNRHPSRDSSRDPAALLLERLFDRALQLSLIAVAAGCDTESWPTKSAGFEAVSCDPVADISPTSAVDFIALREWSPGTTRPVNQIGSTGTPCATARDQGASACRHAKLFQPEPVS